MVESKKGHLIHKETISPWLENLRQVGSSIDKIEHWSAPNRYQAIISLLTTPQNRLSPELQTVCQLFRVDTLKIQDCATGTGQAIVGLAQQLQRHGIKFEIHAYDFEDPQTLVFPGFERDFNQLVQHTDRKSVYSEPDTSEKYDLSILGYLHPYLIKSELISAILNRLAESSVVVLIPASDGLSPLSARFIYLNNNGELTSAIIDPMSKSIR